MSQSLFELIERYSKEQMDKLGLYGWPHARRVLRLCLKIAELEGGRVDLEVLKVAALLHDIAKHVKELIQASMGQPEPKWLKPFSKNVDFQNQR